ncbi:MAG TPA: DUF3969 family protein [Pyrinomonadaceae bacterium]|nr:DUF3969 family protein [Pyrinomonadaceae bacterium]
MNENYEQLSVKVETFEPFVLCLALGTLEAIKSNIWSTEAGIWTIGRPNFLDKLEELKISDETINILVLFDELNALEEFVEKEVFENKILEIEQAIKTRLGNFPNDYWQAKWLSETP